MSTVEELRRAVAEITGQPVETWPEHGNVGLAIAATVELLRRRVEALGGDNAAFRRLLWLRHGCPFGALYGDDGEMQCGTCVVDFKRDPVDVIERRFESLGQRAFLDALASLPKQP